MRQTWGKSFTTLSGSRTAKDASSAIRIKFMVGSEGIAMHKALLDSEISKYGDIFKAHSDPMMAIRGGSSVHHVLQALESSHPPLMPISTSSPTTKCFSFLIDWLLSSDPFQRRVVFTWDAQNLERL